jgi:hypothetical protein
MKTLGVGVYPVNQAVGIIGLAGIMSMGRSTFKKLRN